MKQLLWLLLILLVGLFVLFLAANPGSYVVLVTPQWKIDFSGNFALALLAAIVIFAHYLFRFIGYLIAMPARARDYQIRHRRQLCQQWLDSAALNLTTGYFELALAHASKGFDLAEERPRRALACLLAAKASQSLRDEEKTQYWLEQASAYDRYIHKARLICQAEAMMVFQKPREALECLSKVERKKWGVRAQRLALRAYQDLGQWHKVLRLLRQLEQQGEYNHAPMMPLLRHAHRQALEQWAAAGKRIEQYWQKIPKREQQDSGIASAAAKIFTAQGEEVRARELLSETLKTNWNSDIARQWGDCSSNEEASARLAQAEEWLKKYPRDAGLQHALGRLCLKLQLWGKALHFIKNAIAVEPTPQLHLELGHLQDQLDNKEEARYHYREALNIPPVKH